MERTALLSASITDEARYRLLVDAIADYAVYMLDPNGVISSWNTGARLFKGYNTEEVLGQHFSKFYTQEDREAGVPERALMEARTAGKFESEGWRVRKDGTRFWAHTVIDPIHDDYGKLIGFAKITHDLTARKKTEEELRLAREALFQAQKMEAVGRLTGGVAHDFNNLLMVILGSLELLRKRMPQDVKLLALVDNAMQGAQRGASLTQRMLAFARRQQLTIEAVDLRLLVTGMSGMLQRSLGPEVMIQTNFPMELPPVLTDANQLETALLNLTVNARDAMPNGGVITISAREQMVMPGENGELRPGRYVSFSVEDRGEGMDPETLARATEPFFTTKGPGKGTGLGLPMVHGLATQSGGKLFITSEKDKGTRVDVWLPIAHTEANVAANDDHNVPVMTTAPLRLLVVDDDQLVLTNTTAMLEDMGHTVFTAHSGEQAEEILRRVPQLDMVITDYAMPNLTGVQLAARVRERYPDIPIILATGYAELPPDTINHLPTLLKPFSQTQLMQTVSENAREKPRVLT